MDDIIGAFGARLTRHFGSLNQIDFVQIGAHDGFSCDPIRRLVLQFGWKGVFVEPLPQVFEKLKANYEPFNDQYGRFRYEMSAITDDGKEAKMYVAGRRCVRSSIRPETLRKSTLACSNVTTVAGITLKSLMGKYKINSLSLLQIDVEGYDFGVIKQIDGLWFKPKAIHFEDAQLRMERHDCFNFLRDRGYDLQAGCYTADTLATLRKQTV